MNYILGTFCVTKDSTAMLSTAVADLVLDDLVTLAMNPVTNRGLPFIMYCLLHIVDILVMHIIYTIVYGKNENIFPWTNITG